MAKGFTYLLYDGRNYKIGMTTKVVEERVKELNASSSTYATITLVAFSLVNDCRELEKRLHNYFIVQRIKPNREWFTLDDHHLAYIYSVFKTESVGYFKTPELSPNRIALARLRQLNTIGLLHPDRLKEVETNISLASTYLNLYNKHREEEDTKANAQKVKQARKIELSKYWSDMWLVIKWSAIVMGLGSLAIYNSLNSI